MKNLLQYKIKKRKPAFSLVETVISIAIIAIVLTILFNTVLVTLRISYRNFARSDIREEISEVTTLLSRDIRNADEIVNCFIDETGTGNCELIRDNMFVRWRVCETSICKDVSEDGITFTNEFETANNVVINTFSIEPGFGGNVNAAQNNLLITIIGAHQNENLNINNVLRQQSVSTRNYTL